MKSQLFILLFCLYLTGQAKAQNIIDQYQVRHWTTRDGLADNNIFQLYQTKDGFLWMASFSGLIRFDGVKFETFSSRNVPIIKADNYYSMDETADTTLWIATPNSGLLAYKKGSFQTYMSDLVLGIAVSQKDGRLLCQTNDNQFFLFDPQSKQQEVLDSATGWDKIAKLDLTIVKNQVDGDGNLWLRKDNGLMRIRDSKVKVMGKEEGLPNDRITAIFLDSQDRLWVTTVDKLFLGKKGKFKVVPEMDIYTYPPDAVSGYGTVFHEDQRGGIWLSNSAGLFCLPKGANKFLTFYPSHPLRNIAIKEIISDPEGNIWIATEKGLFQLSESKFINYTRKLGDFAHRINGVCIVDTNRYLISSSENVGKLFWVENGVSRPYEFKHPELQDYKNEVYQIYKDTQGRAWVCGIIATFRIEPEGEKIISRARAIRYMFEDNQGQFWFAIYMDGIYKLNAEDQLEKVAIPGLDLKNWRLSSFRILKNGDWLITSYNQGIARVSKDGQVSIFNDQNGLTTTVIFNTFEDEDGSVWVLSNSGLIRWKDEKFQLINHKDGLPNNSVFAFLEDPQGFVWLPSNRGLVRAKKQEIKDYLDQKNKTIQWELYDDGDGMAVRGCVGARHSDIGSDGTILVPTFGGAVEIDPSRFQKNEIPPPVVVHKVLWDGQALDLNQKAFALAPGNHRFIFEYSGLSLTAPEKEAFKFRLQGYDEDWIEATGDRRAFYTNIPAGSYTFQVIASNNDGVWNEEGATFTFTVKPFFYETTWFRTLMLLLLGLLIYAIVRWRTYNIQQKNKKLELQVAQRTVELKDANEELSQTNEELQTTIELVQQEQKKSDALLLNILPEETAAELKEHGQATPKHYDLVTVLFTDFKGFTRIAEKLSPKDVISELNTCFLAFDEICDKYNLEKIKTIGDSYMCAGGLPLANNSNPVDAVYAALEMQAWMQTWKRNKEVQGLQTWEIRLGIHSGPVVAGVVGKNKFAYDIWGDTVNLASRMESSGEPGKINISGATFELIKNHFQCTYRGKVKAKNKGEVEMYFVENSLQN